MTKEHLATIAGVALIGIAAALVANPMLIQLGVLSGKRKRRDLVSNERKSFRNEKRAHKLAYKGYQ